MLRKTISRAFSRFRRPPLPAPVPVDLAERFALKRAFALKIQFETALKAASDRETLLKQCISMAEQWGWPLDEIEKLRIYAAYFCGNTQYAHAQVVGHRYETVDADMFVIACISLYVNDRFEEAAQLLKRRDVLGPDFAEQQDFLGFAGYIVVAAGKGFHEALRYFDAAIESENIAKVAAINGYPMYFEAGKIEKADLLRRFIHERYPEDPEALYAVGCIELAKDYYPEGFRLCEARYFHPEASRYLNPKLLGKPRWENGSIEAKRLLVHAEQGFGDNVMCARYLPLLQAAGATVILECQEAATSLIVANFPDIEIIPTHQERADSALFDCWVGAMSLPYLFNSTAESVPGRQGYLKAPNEHIDHWQSRLRSLDLQNRCNVGVAWSGNPRHRNDRRRSISFEFFSGYLKGVVGTANIFALQTEVPQTDVPLFDLSEELVTLADTAALIEQMDLVITVDTSIVHLAGALGKKTWLLLPYRYEWRWGLEGPANAWYDSVSVIRQSSNGNWKGVLDQVFLQDMPNLLAANAWGIHVAH